MTNKTTSPTSSTSALSLSESLARTGADARDADAQGPLSVRHPWHRAALLGVLTTLMVLPWTTSTGCGGDQPPVTESGFELFLLTATKEPLIWLAPLSLIAATLLGVVARHVARAGRRAWLSLAIFVIVAGGAFFTWLGMMAPHASEHVEHHFASTAGTIALAAMIFDALARFILGVREWWVARRARRARSTESMLRATHGVGP